MKDRISICGKTKSLGLAASSYQDEENERRRLRSCGAAVKMERGDRGEAVMKKVLILYRARLIKNCTDGLCVRNSCHAFVFVFARAHAVGWSDRWMMLPTRWMSGSASRLSSGEQAREDTH